MDDLASDANYATGQYIYRTDICEMFNKAHLNNFILSSKGHIYFWHSLDTHELTFLIGLISERILTPDAMIGSLLV